jgi:hypothetical protein
MLLDMEIQEKLLPKHCSRLIEEYRFTFHAGTMDEACSRAASIPSIRLLMHCHHLGLPWNEWTTKSATEAGSVLCLRYAHENGCPLKDDICATAAAADSLECLKYGHRHSSHWSTNFDVCRVAAGFGSLRCLEYAFRNKFPWNEETCVWAARNGHLECLCFAYSNGCPLNSSVAFSAAFEGQLQCLIFLGQAACPWDSDNCLVCIFEEQLAIECLETLEFSHDCCDCSKSLNFIYIHLMRDISLDENTDCECQDEHRCIWAQMLKSVYTLLETCKCSVPSSPNTSALLRCIDFDLV